MSVDFANAADVIEVVVPGQTQVITLAVPGLQGPPGRLVVGTVTTGNPGTSATVSAVDNAQGQQVVNFTIPRGDVGAPNTLAIGTVTTGTPGTSATASITGTAPNQTLSLTIPRGDVGATGPAGTITSATASSLAAGSTPTVTLGGTATARTFAFGIPTGATGATGPVNTIAIGTVTTGAPGSSATATITGTAPNQTLNLTIPQGAQGPVGAGAPDATNTAKGSIMLAGDLGGTADLPTVNATNANTPSAIVKRDVNGDASFRTVFVTNVGADTHAANKAYVDGIGSSSVPAGNVGVMRRDTNAAVEVNRVYGLTAPVNADHAANKGYVDARVRVMSRYVTTDYTIIAADDTLQIRTDNATGNVVITAPDLSLPTGFYVDVLRWQNGTFTLAADTGMSFINGPGSAALNLDKYQSVRLIRVSATQWFVQRIDTLGTTAATPDTIVRRSSGADITVGQVYSTTATPSSANSLTRKDYVDAIGTSGATGNTVARRDVNGYTSFTRALLSDPPSAASHATRKDYVDTQVATRAASVHTHLATDISDSTATGRSVLTAVDAAAARTAIGAGTGNSNLVIGTTNTTAKAGDYQPTAANISDATVIGRTVLTSIDAAAVRTAIGAGTSNLAIGTTSTTAKAGDYTPPSDGAAGVATMRTLGTGATQAAAGNDARLSDARTPTAHTHSVTDLTATGTKSATTFLRGDNTWAAPAGGEGAFVVDKTLGNGSTPAAAGIQAQLDAANAAGGGRVYIPNGTYMIGTTLTIGSNTWLQLDPSATLRRAAEINSLLVNKTTGAGGYGGATNIRVSGGVWDGNQTGFTTNCTLMGFGHVDGLIVEEATLRNLAGFWHLLEFNAVRRGRVYNCLFDGLSGTGGATAEMMQLDLAMSTGVFPWFGPYDNTPCDDFVISGCTFRNGQRGFGSHSQLAGFPHTKVHVINNHFENFTDVAITPLYTWDLVISNNTGRECRSFVVIDTPDAEMRNVIISDNVFMNETIQDTANGRGIFLQGGSVATRVILDVVISNNVLRGMGKHGIGPDFCDSVAVIGNNIKSTGTAITGAVTSGGIWMYRVSGGRVIGNRVAITGGASTSADAADIIVGAGTGAVGDTNKIIVADNHATIYRANAMCTDVIEHDNQWTTRTLVAGTSRYQAHHNLTGTTWTA